MAVRANHNRDVAAALQSLLDAYEMGGGSTTFNMLLLRGSFAQTIPFDDPNFHRHFSLFATEAVAKDFRAGRFVYPIGGHPPDPNVPIWESIPYIYPIHFLQNVEEAIDREEGGEERREGERQRGFEQQPEGRDQQRERDGQIQNEERGERERREEGSRNREERTNKRPMVDTELISSDDSLRGVGSKTDTSHVFTFIKTANVNEKPLPAEAKKITALVLEYRSNDLNQAVLAFCWKSGKHHDFPDALVRDLLQYKFINLEKINAGPNACKFDIYSKAKDSDPAAKIKPQAFKEATEWRDAVTLLVETLCIAFVSGAVCPMTL